MTVLMSKDVTNVNCMVTLHVIVDKNQTVLSVLRHILLLLVLIQMIIRSQTLNAQTVQLTIQNQQTIELTQLLVHITYQSKMK